MKKPTFVSELSRRKFITLAGMAAAAAPTFLTGCATRAKRPLSPSERINIGMIGIGTMGTGNTRSLLKLADCRIIAACDLDKKHLEKGVELINSNYGNKECKGYHDFQEIFDREDIDAVVLSVPDHWHALVATAAAKAKKDIYGEKPLARTIAEQQAIVKAVQKNKVIWQTGSWQRSLPNFRKAAEIVRNGLIGKVTRVEVGLLQGHRAGGVPKERFNITPPPPELDYARWVGPSEMVPYRQAQSHRDWRWNYNFGGGQLLDWIGHHCDIAHWGLGFDSTGPFEIEGEGEFPPKDAIWNTCTRYRIELKYPQDITMVIAGGYSDIKQGTKWIGTDGWVHVDRSKFEASNEDWSDYKNLPDELAKTRLYKSDNHHQNFLECIRSRKPTITPVETAHNSATPGHLGLISMLLHRKIRWNHAAQTIVGDEEASKLLTRPYRKGYTLKV